MPKNGKLIGLIVAIAGLVLSISTYVVGSHVGQLNAQVSAEKEKAAVVEKISEGLEKKVDKEQYQLDLARVEHKLEVIEQLIREKD